ncbi:hypothetical protein L3073_12890 [Ancylomarina sp. DW003]|nr:hypothetical protein [Ancylomarina sp. DW003]MDE5423108.1 hypothetical protein [Ancylomarina sp. DW003]
MKKIYLLLTLLLFSLIVNAGINGPGIKDSPGIYPNFEKQYSISLSGDWNFEWSVEGGKIIRGKYEYAVIIRWHDSNVDGHKVKLTAKAKNTPKILNFSESVKVFSLKGEQPAEFTAGDKNISFGDNTAVTYTIPRLNYPADPGFGGESAASYDWIIPSGWRHNNKISNGTDPINTDDSSITVYPDDCTGGTIKVFGVPFYSDMSKSEERVRKITRSTPPMKSSTFTTTCGNPKEITLEVANISNATYQWTKPSAWLWTSSTNTNIVKVMPNGSSGGAVSVNVNGCTNFTQSQQIAFYDWDPNEPEPKITGAKVVCSGGSTYTLVNAYSNATSVTWSASPASLFSNASGNSSSAFLKAKSSATSGSAQITFTLRNQCGASHPVKHNVWVGIPNNIRGKMPNHEEGEYPMLCKIDHYISDNSLTVRCDGADFDAEYKWNIWNNGFAYNIRQNRIQFQPYTEGGVAFDVKVKNSCGWSDSEGFIFPVIDCDGPGGLGEEMFIMPSSGSANENEEIDFNNVDEISDYQKSSQVLNPDNSTNSARRIFMMSHPNPANQYTELNFYSENELSTYQKDSPTMISISLSEQTQELGEYEIQIWSERKGLVKKLKARDKKLQIKTNTLDEGLYFLHVIVNGRVYKQKLRIKR